MRVAPWVLACCVALPLAGARAQGFMAVDELEFGSEVDFGQAGRRSGRRAASEVSFEAELGLVLRLPAGFAVQAVLDARPAGREEADGGLRGLRAQAAWLDQLFLRWDGGPVRLFAGKIHPRFGLGWYRAPGLSGDELADVYELDEKIGAGVRLALLGGPQPAGQHSLQLEVFHADRSALSGSLVSRRWALDGPDGRTRYLSRNRRATGGPDNTAGFRNMVLSLEGEDVRLAGGSLFYTLGHARRLPGDDTRAEGLGATERGYVAGAGWAFPLGGVTVTPMGEWLRQADADGLRGLRRQVVTLGVEAKRGRAGLSYVHAWLAERGTGRGNARLHTVSGFYELPWGRGLTASLGWSHLRDGDDSSDGFGAQIAFSFPQPEPGDGW